MSKGNLEKARTEYINALRFKPNQPDVLEKINELNLKLGTIPGATELPVDSVKVVTVPVTAPADLISEPVCK